MSSRWRRDGRRAVRGTRAPRSFDPTCQGDTGTFVWARVKPCGRTRASFLPVVLIRARFSDFLVLFLSCSFCSEHPIRLLHRAPLECMHFAVLVKNHAIFL